MFRVNFPQEITEKLLSQLKQVLRKDQLEVLWAIIGVQRADEANEAGKRATPWETELAAGCIGKDPFMWGMWSLFRPQGARGSLPIVSFDLFMYEWIAMHPICGDRSLPTAWPVELQWLHCNFEDEA